MNDEGVNVGEAVRERISVLTTEKRIPDAVKYPDINGGMCEFCGQDCKKCKHYAGADIFCTYCQRSDILKERKLTVRALASKPNSLIIICNDYLCEKKHNDRFPQAGQS